MLGAKRDGEGHLRGLSVELVVVEFVAVPQQHAGQRNGNTKNKRMATFKIEKSATVFSLRHSYYR